jgi:hypothetical protein
MMAIRFYSPLLGHFRLSGSVLAHHPSCDMFHVVVATWLVWLEMGFDAEYSCLQTFTIPHSLLNFSSLFLLVLA